MRLSWWVFAALLLAAGCARDAGQGQKADPQVAGRSGGRRAAADGGTVSVADGGVMQGSAKAPEPKPDPAPDAGVMQKPTTPEKKPAPAADSGNPPCDVAEVLKARCARCHGKTLREGAPVKLVDAADFQRDLGGLTVGQAALRRVRDAARPMPPPPAARLAAAEESVLAGWIEAGAKPGQPGCSADDAPADMTPPERDGGGVVVTHPDPEDAGVEPADAAQDAASEPEPETHANWPMFGADLANSRSNPLETTLTPDNVAGLRELWRFDGPATSCAPAVVDGVIYLAGWNGRVYALRLDDGSSVWTANLPDLIDSSPTITDRQVFVSDDNGSVHALDRATGARQWSRSVDGHEEAHLWSSPIYIPSAELVVVGVASGEEQVPKIGFSFRGSVVGLDADSGEIRWRFENASADSGSGPGIGSWGTAAVDEGRKLVFIGTGNNYEAPSGEYSDSLLAIDYESGELEWSRQFTDNDVYSIYGSQGVDYDIGSSANLFSADDRDLVGIGIKSGDYFALARDSGEIIWRNRLGSGSVLGGVISASAYADGTIFVANNNFVLSTTRAVAIDAQSGDTSWSADLSGMTYAGVAHANGIVFFGSTSGTIQAFDAVSGDTLWIDQTPNNQPIAGSPTVADGKLLVPWGYQWTLREGSAGRGGLTVYGLR